MKEFSTENSGDLGVENNNNNDSNKYNINNNNNKNKLANPIK